MLPELYTDMARLEASHFWFRGRNEILKACLHRFLPKTPGKLILDAGCGTGANLDMLGQFGKVLGVELHGDACRYAVTKFPGRLLQGSLESMPLRDGYCSVVALLDVLEHVDDQQDVLGELFRVLAPGGALLITVPAFRHLWSEHDVAHHHKRRYRAEELRREIEKAGMQVVYLSYFNTHLYPLVAATRLLGRFRKVRSGSDMKLPPVWLNQLLYQIFRAERLWVGRCISPLGVSLLALARKPL